MNENINRLIDRLVVVYKEYKIYFNKDAINILNICLDKNIISIDTLLNSFIIYCNKLIYFDKIVAFLNYLKEYKYDYYQDNILSIKDRLFSEKVDIGLLYKFSVNTNIGLEELLTLIEKKKDYNLILDTYYAFKESNKLDNSIIKRIEKILLASKNSYYLYEYIMDYYKQLSLNSDKLISSFKKKLISCYYDNERFGALEFISFVKYFGKDLELENFILSTNNMELIKDYIATVKVPINIKHVKDVLSNKYIDIINYLDNLDNISIDSLFNLGINPLNEDESERICKYQEYFNTSKSFNLKKIKK